MLTSINKHSLHLLGEILLKWEQIYKVMIGQTFLPTVLHSDQSFEYLMSFYRGDVCLSNITKLFDSICCLDRYSLLSLLLYECKSWRLVKWRNSCHVFVYWETRNIHIGENNFEHPTSNFKWRRTQIQWWYCHWTCHQHPREADW